MRAGPERPEDDQGGARQRTATVALVAGDELRAVLRDRLDAHPTLGVVVDVSDGSAARTAFASHRPDLVVLGPPFADTADHATIGSLRSAARGARLVLFADAPMPSTEGPAGADVRWVPLEGGVEALIRALEGSLTAPAIASASFPADVTASVAARRFVEAVLEDWGAGELLDAALVIVSELVSNACTHAASSCTVTLCLDHGALRVEVSDQAAALPEERPVDVDRPGGRGLLIVAALSAAWGVERLDVGKSVWAVIPGPRDPR